MNFNQTIIRVNKSACQIIAAANQADAPKMIFLKFSPRAGLEPAT